MPGLGLVGAFGQQGLRDSIKQRLMEEQAAKQQAFLNMLAERRVATDEQQVKQQGDWQRAQFEEKVAAANEAEVGKGVSGLSIDQSIPDPLARRIGPTMHAANMRINPALAQPPNMPDMMQPDIVPGQQPGAVWTGTDKQREGEQMKRGQLRIIESLPAGSRERLALEYEQATGKNPPAGVFDPKPTPTEPLEQVNEGGKPIYRPRGEAIGKPAYHVPPQPSTVVVQGPNGPMIVDKTGGTGKPVTDPSGAPVGPTDSAAVKTQKTQATNVRVHIADISKQADEINKLGLMGPVGGRWAAFLTGKIGSAEIAATPEQQELLEEFRTNVGLLKSGMAMVHGGARGGGSVQIMHRMDALINADQMNLPLFKGALKSFDTWLKTYAGKGDDTTTPQTADPLGLRGKP